MMLRTVVPCSKMFIGKIPSLKSHFVVLSESHVIVTLDLKLAFISEGSIRSFLISTYIVQVLPSA